MEKTKVSKAAASATPKSKAPLSHGVGRRKSAVARVWLHRGNGQIMVNGKDFTAYFDTDISRLDASVPFRAIPGLSYNVVANIQGGGLPAQADALSLATARAVVLIDEALRTALRKHNLLTCDSRVKERKKYGQKAARRKFQFVKR
jgi:small subunit ribosomal protein S9